MSSVCVCPLGDLYSAQFKHSTPTHPCPLLLHLHSFPSFLYTLLHTPPPFKFFLLLHSSSFYILPPFSLILILHSSSFYILPPFHSSSFYIPPHLHSFSFYILPPFTFFLILHSSSFYIFPHFTLLILHSPPFKLLLLLHSSSFYTPPPFTLLLLLHFPSFYTPPPFTSILLHSSTFTLLLDLLHSCNFTLLLHFHSSSYTFILLHSMTFTLPFLLHFLLLHSSSFTLLLLHSSCFTFLGFNTPPFISLLPLQSSSFYILARDPLHSTPFKFPLLHTLFPFFTFSNHSYSHAPFFFDSLSFQIWVDWFDISNLSFFLRPPSIYIPFPSFFSIFILDALW